MGYVETDQDANHPGYFLPGGLREEERVIAYLASIGYPVAEADSADQLADIDGWLDDEAVSIKAEHEGFKYGHLYVELATQRYSPARWEGLTLPWGQAALEHAQALTGQSLCAYNPGWFYYSQAAHYVIVQDRAVYLLQALQLKHLLQLSGLRDARGRQMAPYPYVRCRSLSPQRLRQQGGKDTICAYLVSAAFTPLGWIGGMPCT